VYSDNHGEAVINLQSGTMGRTILQAVADYPYVRGEHPPVASSPLSLIWSFSDTSPPLITPHVVGTVGANEWYISPVEVSWSVADPESGISTASGCGDTILTTDTAGTIVTCMATNGVGLTATRSVSVVIHLVLPTSTPTPIPTTQAALSVSPTAQVAGVGVDVAGAHFLPNETVHVRYAALLTSGVTTTVQVYTIADSNGTVTIRNLPVPASVQPGSYQIQATGLTSGRSAVVWLRVVAPTPTNTPVPTASKTVTPSPTPSKTPAPTATMSPVLTATPTPTSTVTPYPPSITIDLVQISHLVKGKQRETTVLRLNEKATFVVLYHTDRVPQLARTGALSITKGSRQLSNHTLQAVTLNRHNGFSVTFSFSRQRAVGTLVAHFEVTSGTLNAKRNRRFSVRP
jgi:hypothetical protein